MATSISVANHAASFDHVIIGDEAHDDLGAARGIFASAVVGLAFWAGVISIFLF